MNREESKLERRETVICTYPAPRRTFRPAELEVLGVLLAVDLLALLLALLGGVGIRASLGAMIAGLPPFDAAEHLHRLMGRPWLFAPIPLVFLWRGLYRRLPFWEEIRRLFLAIGEGFVFIFALISLAKLGLELSRLTLFFMGLLALVFLPLFRHLAKRALFRFKRYRIPVLICPAGPEGEALLKALEREPSLGYEIIGFLDDRPSWFGRLIAGRKVYGPVRQAGKFARLRGVDAVFVVAEARPFPKLRDLYAYLQRNVREIYFVPRFMELGLFNAQIALLFFRQMALIRVSNPLSSRLNQALKRLLDLTGALLLGILFAPVALLIALAIKLDSPGPVIFSQERIGRRGRPFRIYKFRTMFVDAEERLEECLAADPERRRQWIKFRKLEDDPRVTRTGKWLRRFSLDELPQIINIIKGEMSLVGPRPAMKEELKAFYSENIHFYTAVRPGLTGLWQVSGRNKLSFEERVRLDLWYVQNWSPWLDLVILLRTIPVVLKCEGSY